ncbi:MFS transporter [Arthrobacter sp. 135MFCol5.1]|uniref:MFS transporter n=1 Tax=Arthrobacter sp. 135MFCol5.1 TaxID=1158050 RepID=UPI00037B570F|nr:MFS transporter [Arthrobacter sp. 135MFCol5.1]
MTSSHPIPEHGVGRPKGRGFVAATLSFACVFGAGSAAMPLYDTYRSADGLTNDQFSLVSVAYFVCAVFALLVLGRLSNHHGRRPVSIAALLIGAAGCLTLLSVHSFLPLLVGRALQGLAAGLASSAIGAYIVDIAPRRPRWLVAAITSAGAAVGLAVGVFFSGILVELAPTPRELTFFVFAGVLLGCAIALTKGPETVPRTAGAWASLVPRLAVPAASRRYLPLASGIFVATWAIGGYFTSFGPSIAAENLGAHSPLAAAAVFASYMAPSFFGGFISGRLTPAAAQRVGMTLVALSGIGLTYASSAGTLGLYIGAGVIGGIGMGAATSGSMNALLAGALPKDRAGLLAVIFAISYTGSAVPSLIAGQASRVLNLPAITAGYAVLAILVWLTTIVAARNPSSTYPHAGQKRG